MPTILVADDDPDILHLIVRILERAGHTVVQARDGQEAVRALFDRRPDLVILDVNMPARRSAAFTRLRNSRTENGFVM